MIGMIRTQRLRPLDAVHFVRTRRLGEESTGLVPNVLQHSYMATRYAGVVVLNVTILASGTRKCLSMNIFCHLNVLMS